MGRGYWIYKEWLDSGKEFTKIVEEEPDNDNYYKVFLSHTEGQEMHRAVIFTEGKDKNGKHLINVFDEFEERIIETTLEDIYCIQLYKSGKIDFSLIREE